MDPDAVYRRLMDSKADYGSALTDEDAFVAADEVMCALDDLDGWIRKGGFLPRKWVV